MTSARRNSVSVSSPPQSIPIPHGGAVNVPVTSPSFGSPPSARSPFAAGTSPIQAFFAAGGITHNTLPGTSPSTGGPGQSSNPSSVYRAPRHLQPLGSEEIKILLLENISADAVAYFKAQGYQVHHYTKAWTEEELLEKLGDYHAIGIRSKTKITEKVLKAATKLLVIGCFCIGTNQVALKAAASAGVAVFNSPFSNSRSVAELVLAEVVCLSRQLTDRAREMREGVWNKVSKGCWEIRGKTLGIVGYGHIGTQLSVLAEAFGMQVIYYDVVPIMPLGSARQVDTLPELLSQSDFVSLHVPELPETKNMIQAEELSQMKDGAYLINNARGTVVDLEALASALESGKLAGAAVDVFPKEPGSNGPGFNDNLNPTFSSRIQKAPNTILTPHIGGSTEEAQRMIGAEVSSALSRYLTYGTTVGAVNFPEVDLRAIAAEDERHIRVCHIHRNEPGVLRAVNEIFAEHNIEKSASDSKGDIAYLMADISDVTKEEVHALHAAIQNTKANIITRLLY
ncbi:d-3-phosphoglycerate dehydrogenase 2 [Phaffia rhodozyma]|uniref:phosphoglycerate dehydrogenase n=1 Tax=Phaffia rhodozyma TaxID=264483 RepID=A0A0F7SJS4_PHARH|nr:d-3-phosphoglycerate dehydrogenase 2 [Phaffia rhodozyma]